uniref:RING-type domain-containing protein n=1 Tax=Macrostomum lignano TaxID=282301 RepID=A0A1I8JQK0_9PLAT
APGRAACRWEAHEDEGTGRLLLARAVGTIRREPPDRGSAGQAENRRRFQNLLRASAAINGGSGGESVNRLSPHRSTASAGAAASRNLNGRQPLPPVAADDSNGRPELLCERKLEFRVRLPGLARLPGTRTMWPGRGEIAAARAATQPAQPPPAGAVDSRCHVDNETESQQQRDQLIPAQPSAARHSTLGRRPAESGGRRPVAPTRWTLSSTGSASAAGRGRPLLPMWPATNVNKIRVMPRAGLPGPRRCRRPPPSGTDGGCAHRKCRLPALVGGSCRCRAERSAGQQQPAAVVKKSAPAGGDTDALLSASPFPSPQEEPSKCIPACTWDASAPWTGPWRDSTALNHAINTAVAEVADGSRQATPVNARCRRPVCDSNPATNAGSSTACGATALGAFECHVCRCEPSCRPALRALWRPPANLRIPENAWNSLAATPAEANASCLQQSGRRVYGCGRPASRSDIVQAVTSLFRRRLRRLSINCEP